MAGGSTTNYFHDVDDRLWEEEIPSLGFTLVYEYDNNGNLVRERDEFQSLTQYEYDAENRLTKITPPQGAPTTFTYKSSGQRRTSRMTNDCESDGASTTHHPFSSQGMSTPPQSLRISCVKAAERSRASCFAESPRIAGRAGRLAFARSR